MWSLEEPLVGDAKLEFGVPNANGDSLLFRTYSSSSDDSDESSASLSADSPSLSLASSSPSISEFVAFSSSASVVPSPDRGWITSPGFSPAWVVDAPFSDASSAISLSLRLLVFLGWGEISTRAFSAPL